MPSKHRAARPASPVANLRIFRGTPFPSRKYAGGVPRLQKEYSLGAVSVDALARSKSSLRPIRRGRISVENQGDDNESGWLRHPEPNSTSDGIREHGLLSLYADRSCAL